MSKHILKAFITVSLISGLAALSNAAIRVKSVPLGKSGIVMPMLPGPSLPLTPFIHSLKSGLTLTPTLKSVSLPRITLLGAGAAVQSVAIPVSVIPVAPVAAVAAENDHSFKPTVVAKKIAGIGEVFGMKDGSVKSNDHDAGDAFDGTKRGGNKTGELDEDLIEDGDFSGSRPVIFRPARRVTLPTQDLEDELGIQGWD
ncbi:MAG: hypothetical protein V3S11_00615 [Elusimicrobiota bacterium]